MIKKYNIVFLDFDGVLNGIKLRRWKHLDYSLDEELEGALSKVIENYPKGWEHFDNDIFYDKILILIEALNLIPDLKIVLSTSWRKLKLVHHFDFVFKKIPGWNFDIIGRTGNDPHRQRGTEIDNWINLNKDIVLNYIIIDDETCGMLPKQKPRIVKTSVNYGICKKDILKIKRIIKEDKKCIDISNNQITE